MAIKKNRTVNLSLGTFSYTVASEQRALPMDPYNFSETLKAYNNLIENRIKAKEDKIDLIMNGSLVLKLQHLGMLNGDFLKLFKTGRITDIKNICNNCIEDMKSFGYSVKGELDPETNIYLYDWDIVPKTWGSSQTK